MKNVSGESLGSRPLAATQGRRGKPPRQPSENDLIFSTCAVTPREETLTVPLNPEGSSPTSRTAGANGVPNHLYSTVSVVTHTDA
jgi:hypothetical protein